MSGPEFVSVLTGDLIGYSQNVDSSEEYLKNLEGALTIASRSFNFNFQIFRGDSFQAILQNPNKSLEVALLIRSFLISQLFFQSDHPADGNVRRIDERKEGSPVSRTKQRHDARIAIGIGPVDFYDLNNVGHSDGYAFRMSGRRLDEMKKRKENLSIVTPWDDYNRELDVECALMDVIIAKWTRDQSLSVFYTLQGMNQYQISDKLNRSQSGISQRLTKAGYGAMCKMMERFDERIDQKSDPSAIPSVL